MGFEGQKHTQARAAGRVAVQIRHRAVGSETHVPAQIQRAGISGPVRRTWPVHAIHRIVEQLAGVAQRNRPAQLRPHAAAGNKRIHRQRIIRNLVQPPRAPLAVGSERQQQIAGAKVM